MQAPPSGPHLQARFYTIANTIINSAQKGAAKTVLMLILMAAIPESASGMDGIDGIDGSECTKTLNPECMVMILTGFGKLDSAIQAVRQGADDYMLKPGTPEERLLRVQELLQKADLQRKIKAYSAFLPICCVCKRIRYDTGKPPGEGEWMAVETYLHKLGKQQITSGYCPACYAKVHAKL